MRLALAMIVKGDDTEADYLSNCLNSVVDHVDDIFITITHKKGESINKRVQEVAEYYNAFISTYEWTNNFADARNFNFSQVPDSYAYILWLDADDIISGGEKLRPTIEENSTVDIFSLWYNYAFDSHGSPIVVHHKSQIIRNDGCVTWEGHLHEDFKENRTVVRKHIEGITRNHMSDHDHFDDAKERNLEIALKQKETYPNDPRSYWNTANSYKACGENEKAMEEFDVFMRTSQSEEEKYIAHIRRAEILWQLEKKEDAFTELRTAIGLRPEYPDAYCLLGQLYFHAERFTDAVSMLKTALIKKPPYYKIVLFNPRDYDYTPLRWLALSYIKINQPILAYECLNAMLQITPQDKELKKQVKMMKKQSDRYEKILEKCAKIGQIKDKAKMKKALDALPDDFKYHPLVCNLRNKNFIKETSSGKDVVIMCGYTDRQWTPETAITEGIGGSEEAVIHLGKRLVERGFNVTVYNNCGHTESTHDGVVYKPFMAWNYRDKQDVTIIWRHPRLAEYEINSGKIFIDMHDVIQDGEFTPQRLTNIDKVFVKSEFHKSLFPSIPEDKFVVVPNGIDVAQFDNTLTKEKLLVNTSSPDRSLTALVKGFKKLKERVPDVTCEWAYGWGVFDSVHKNNAQMLEWKAQVEREMEEAGIVNRGRVTHDEVREMYERAKIFAYPSEFAEIDCISLTKAMASGAIPVTTDFAAMGEKANHGGYFIHSDKNKDTWVQPYQFDFSLSEDKIDEWVAACVKALDDTSTNDMRTFAESFDWEKVVDVWEANM